MRPGGPNTKTSIPFAALPHEIAADPRLSGTDRGVLPRPSSTSPGPTTRCWPCDNRRWPGPSAAPGTVRRCPGSPPGGPGYVRVEHVRASNPTGRLIQLTCREPDWERPRQAPVKPVATCPSKRLGIERPAGVETGWTRRRIVVVERLRTEESANSRNDHDRDPAPPPVDLPTPPAAVPLQAEVRLGPRSPGN